MHKQLAKSREYTKIICCHHKCEDNIANHPPRCGDTWPELKIRLCE